MDAFESAEAMRRLLAAQVIPVWLEFQSEVQSLTESYNKTPLGRRCPARLKTLHDSRVLIVTSLRGYTEDQYNLITIEIRARFEEQEFRIEATIKKWLAPQGSPPVELINSTEYVFQLEGDLQTKRDVARVSGREAVRRQVR
jgi:hypothetical protein